MKMEVHYLNSDNNTKKETDERQKTAVMEEMPVIIQENR